MHFTTVAIPVFAVLTAMQGTTAPFAKAKGAKAAGKAGGGGLFRFGKRAIGQGIREWWDDEDDNRRMAVRSVRFEQGRRAGILARDERPPVPDLVNEHDWERCLDAIEGASAIVTGPVNGGIELTGVPSDCMPLAVHFIDYPLEEDDIIPIVCGSDCIRYDDLSEEDYNFVKEVFESL